ncbi:MAG: hypothetical protein MRZ36_00335 [Eubacterium sp.]|nr:hypothetical protein [Eubacterium sp.]
MTTDKKLTQHMLVNTVLFFLVVFGILLFSERQTYTRQLEQIDQYTAELSKRTAEHVGDVFGDRKDTIRSIAYLYGTSLKSPKADKEYLKNLEKNSGFDRIRIVDTAGQSYTSDGKLTTVSDRDYYTKGINGGFCAGIRYKLDVDSDVRKEIGKYI